MVDGCSMDRTMIFYELGDALAQPGCAICRLNAGTAEQFVDGLLWENVNDPGVRARIRQAQGFCHKHSSILIRPGASSGVAILMHDVLKSVLLLMEGARFEALPALSLRRAQEHFNPRQPAAATADLVSRLTPSAKCPACVHVEAMEHIYLSTLVEHLLGPENLLPAYQTSDGLCLTHFRQALSRIRDKAVLDSIIDTQQAIWQQLACQLAEAIRKSDYRFHDEPVGDESGAWLRAVAALSGAREPDSS